MTHWTHWNTDVHPCYSCFVITLHVVHCMIGWIYVHSTHLTHLPTYASTKSSHIIHISRINTLLVMKYAVLNHPWSFHSKFECMLRHGCTWYWWLLHGKRSLTSPFNILELYLVCCIVYQELAVSRVWNLSTRPVDVYMLKWHVITHPYPVYWLSMMFDVVTLDQPPSWSETSTSNARIDPIIYYT